MKPTMAQNQSNWEADKMYVVSCFILALFLFNYNYNYYYFSILCFDPDLFVYLLPYFFLMLFCRLDVYIYDYLMKRKLHATAKAFVAEGKVATDPVGKIADYFLQC